MAALRARARAVRAQSSSPTSSARRSSSRTTEGSLSPSWPSGSAFPSGRSRAGCSPGSRACASSSTTRPRKDHGNRNSRADRGIRTRRARLPTSGAPTRRTSRAASTASRSSRRSGTTTEALAVAASGPEPSPALRERILADVRAEPPQNVVPFEPHGAGASLPCSAPSRPIAAVVALAVGLWASDLSSELDETRAALEREQAAAPILVDPTRAERRPPGRRRSSRRRRRRAGGPRARRSRSRSGGEDVRDVDRPGRRHQRAESRRAVSRDATGPRSSDSRAPSPTGDVVAVTVESAGGVDAPTTCSRSSRRTPSERTSLCGRIRPRGARIRRPCGFGERRGRRVRGAGFASVVLRRWWPSSSSRPACRSRSGSCARSRARSPRSTRPRSTRTSTRSSTPSNGRTVLAVLRGDESRVLVGTEDIAPIMRQAIVSVEDQRFFEHNGDRRPRRRARALAGRPPAGNRRGRLDDHAAVRQERVHPQRADARTQGARGGARLAARAALERRTGSSPRT